MRSLVRETRQRVGLSMADLGMRMGVSPTSVSSLERNEAAGSAKVGTIHRALKAMGVEPVTIVVNQPDAARAEANARRVALSVERTMALEGQNLPADAVTKIYDRALCHELAKL